MQSEEMQRRRFGAFDTRLQDLIPEALAGDPATAGFEVHYQPIVRLDDTEVVAVEALARWHHPVAGDVPTPVFIALAEHAGLTGVLDDFVLDRACADARALADVYGHEIDVHVNISASRIGRADLEAAVEWTLRRYRLPPGRLILELTDASRIADSDLTAAAVGRIRARGVGVALDDFGAGFNTMALLHSLPVDIVKLDPLLTSPDAEAWRTEALCRSVLAICNEMSLKIVAKCVETVAHARILQQMQCHLAQGYLYGPPLPLDQLTAYYYRVQSRARLKVATRVDKSATGSADRPER